jgi:hypothetical protein
MEFAAARALERSATISGFNCCAWPAIRNSSRAASNCCALRLSSSVSAIFAPWHLERLSSSNLTDLPAELSGWPPACQCSWKIHRHCCSMATQSFPHARSPRPVLRCGIGRCHPAECPRSTVRRPGCSETAISHVPTAAGSTAFAGGIRTAGAAAGGGEHLPLQRWAGHRRNWRHALRQMCCSRAHAWPSMNL